MNEPTTGSPAGGLDPPKTGTVRVVVPVAWGDMDALGHVNNTVYLRWFESARIRYFEALGLAGGLPGLPGAGPILAHQRIDYRLPLRYPEVAETAIRAEKLGNTSLSLSFEIRRQSDQALAAQGEGVLVLIDYQSGKKLALPEDLRRRIATLEGT